MKVMHMYAHEPMFELSNDERAIVISALQTFVAGFSQDETAKRMLHTFEQIDAAVRIMQEIASGQRKEQ